MSDQIKHFWESVCVDEISIWICGLNKTDGGGERAWSNSFKGPD